MKIRKPDDFHMHFREGQTLINITPFTACVFARAVAMANTVPAKATADEALTYGQDILSAAANYDFSPILTIMLTRRTTPGMVREAGARGVRILKYIPLGVSTNSEESLPLEELENFYPVIRAAQSSGMVFSGHWEQMLSFSGRRLPELHWESAAITFLDRLIRNFPQLRIVVEHATTLEMIGYIKQAPDNIAATLTAHHAMLTFADVQDDAGNITNPYNYCKPIAKTGKDRDAVRVAMISGNKKFFFGSDSAWHPDAAKTKTPPAAGIFSAPVALPLLAQIFEEEAALEKLEEFVSEHGANFYGLPKNSGTIELVKEEWLVPEYYEGSRIFCGGKTLRWKVA